MNICGLWIECSSLGLLTGLRVLMDICELWIDGSSWCLLTGLQVSMNICGLWIYGSSWCLLTVAHDEHMWTLHYLRLFMNICCCCCCCIRLIIVFFIQWVKNFVCWWLWINRFHVKKKKKGSCKMKFCSRQGDFKISAAHFLCIFSFLEADFPWKQLNVLCSVGLRGLSHCLS